MKQTKHFFHFVTPSDWLLTFVTQNDFLVYVFLLGKKKKQTYVQIYDTILTAQ